MTLNLFEGARVKLRNGAEHDITMNTSVGTAFVWKSTSARHNTLTWTVDGKFTKNDYEHPGDIVEVIKKPTPHLDGHDAFENIAARPEGHFEGSFGAADDEFPTRSPVVQADPYPKRLFDEWEPRKPVMKMAAAMAEQLGGKIDSWEWISASEVEFTIFHETLTREKGAKRHACYTYIFRISVTGAMGNAAIPAKRVG